MQLPHTRRILAKLPRLGRVEVCGESMLPSYRPGDWLVVGVRWPVSSGCVVVARDPRQRERLVVKRILRREPAGWWLAGDNPDESTDSRTYGAVPDDLVLARVLWRYWPVGDR